MKQNPAKSPQNRRPAAPRAQAAGQNAADEPFWRKPLADLTEEEWEKLCDGCGRCCLVKLEDEDSGRIWHTSVACRLLDAETCGCADYANRAALVPDCLRLTIELIPTLRWLPPSCAYRLRYEGKDLPAWHPLVSGDPQTIHAAGASVRGKVSALETDVPEEDLPDYIVTWPDRAPRAKKARA